jgi:hypothetical protein
MNKAPIPVFKTGANKSMVLCHSDLDGCNALQICHKWLKETLGKDHVVEFQKATYEKINGLADEAFQEHTEYRYILIGDISVSEELSKRLPPNCFIFDHHDTSKFLIGHPQCYWAEGICGAVVAWKALFAGRTPDPKFGKLMKICNQYDIWVGHPTKFGPPQISHDMNALIRNIGYTKFFEKFYNGFTEFDKYELSIIEEHWKIQNEAHGNADKLDYGEDIILLIMNDERMDPNYWCNEYISEGKKAVLVFYPNSSRLSLRVHPDLKGKFHGGFFLQENIKNTNNSKGGHALAAGCSVEGMDIDGILNIGNILKAALEKLS